MTECIPKFLEKLSTKEGALLPDLKDDKLGLILRTAINELDWYYYNWSRTGEHTREKQEQYYMLGLGVTRLIKLALEARPAFDVPTVMIPRTPQITMPVLNIVDTLGFIEHGRRMVQFSRDGVCSIAQIDEDEFEFVLPAVIPDQSAHENAIASHYAEAARQYFHEGLSEIEPAGEIQEKLYDLVFPFQKYFIGYGADPLLDEYFFVLAYFEVHQSDGFDTFHYKTRFGGVRFQNYILGLAFVVCFSIRHERFAEALASKNPESRIENLLTISSDTGEFIPALQEAINHFGCRYEDHEEISLEDAQRIFEVLSCGRSNTDLLSRAAAPVPMLIRSSDEGFIRCLAGARNNPVLLLLNSLRYHFPEEYNKNQQRRELAMQNAVERALRTIFPDLCFERNLRIKLDGKILTDADLIATDKGTGAVFLFQLKHQELYGSDLHAKGERSKRLINEVEKWLNATKFWISKNPEESIRSALHLKKQVPTLSIHRIILSKHYAHPLKTLELDEKTACVNWMQFFNAISLLRSESDKQGRLHDLYPILKKYALLPDGEHLDEPDTEWKLGELRFRVIQEVA